MEFTPGGLNPVPVAAVNHINDRLHDQAASIHTFNLVSDLQRDNLISWMQGDDKHRLYSGSKPPQRLRPNINKSEAKCSHFEALSLVASQKRVEINDAVQQTRDF